jgi:putative hydrolase of the HAD superfamily
MVFGQKVRADPAFMHIKAVTFDVGGTLIEPWPSVGHVYAAVAAQHGVENLSADTLNTRFRAAWKARPGFRHSREAWSELVDEVFLGAARTPPSETFFPALYDRFAEPDAWHIFDDVLPTLNGLSSRGIKLGVISNWDERLCGLLRKLKLDGYFESMSISCEVGVPKPSPAIFEHAANALRLPANTILHIGDSLEMDVNGARAAGFNALRIHRGGGTDDAHSLSSLGGIFAKLSNLSGEDKRS